MDANAASLIEGYLADLGLLFGDCRVADAIMASRAPDEVIGRGPNDEPFFERWYLRRAAKSPTDHHIGNVYLHRFLRSDREDVHDHPWDNGTLVLRGGYTEFTPELAAQHRYAGDVVTRSAEQRHAIVAIEPGTVSLFVTLKKRREWGFWPTDDQFIHHRNYRAWKDGVSPPGSGAGGL